MNYLTKTKPYAHQERAFLAAWEALEAAGGFALFMEMGTGKTKTAIDLAANLFDQGKIDRVLVVAPSGIQVQWADEQVPAHSPVATARYTWTNSSAAREARARRDFSADRNLKLKMLFVNVERFSTAGDYLEFFRLYLAEGRALMIIDEATRIKNPDAERTKRIRALGNIARYRLILTGTPLTASPFDVYAPLEFCRPGFFGCNFFIFRSRYGIFVRDRNRATGARFNRTVTEKDLRLVRWHLEKGNTPEEIAAYLNMGEADVRYIADRPALTSPYKNLENLRANLHAAAFFVLKSECLDLPEKIYTTIPVVMGADQERIYKELRDTMIARYADQELTVQNKIGLYLRLQQITGGFFPADPDLDASADLDVQVGGRPIGKTNPKTEALVHAIAEAGDDPILIWARFTAEVRAIGEAVRAAYPEKVVAEYYGAVSADDRARIKTEFQEGLVDVLILNPQCGSMGLNLQRSALAFYFSNSFDLEARMQSEDRIHRIGQDRHAVFVDLVVPGTIDERIRGCLQGKRDLLDYFREAPLASVI